MVKHTSELHTCYIHPEIRERASGESKNCIPSSLLNEMFQEYAGRHELLWLHIVEGLDLYVQSNQ